MVVYAGVLLSADAAYTAYYVVDHAVAVCYAVI